MGKKSKILEENGKDNFWPKYTDDEYRNKLVKNARVMKIIECIMFFICVFTAWKYQPVYGWGWMIVSILASSFILEILLMLVGSEKYFGEKRLNLYDELVMNGDRTAAVTAMEVKKGGIIRKILVIIVVMITYSVADSTCTTIMSLVTNDQNEETVSDNSETKLSDIQVTPYTENEEDTTYTEDDYINAVKYGSPEAYSDITYNESLEKYFESGSWDYMENADEKKVVVFSGKLEDREVEINFLLDIENGSFDVSGIYVNGKELDENDCNTMIASIFETYTKEETQPDSDNYKVGDSVLTNNFEFTVTNTYILDGLGEGKKVPEGAVYVVIQYKYKNISKQPISSWDLPEVQLVDSNDAVYSQDFDASIYLEEYSDVKVVSDMNPGIVLKDAQIFEVAKDIVSAGGMRAYVKADQEFFVDLDVDRQIDGTDETQSNISFSGSYRDGTGEGSTHLIINQHGDTISYRMYDNISGELNCEEYDLKIQDDGTVAGFWNFWFEGNTLIVHSGVGGSQARHEYYRVGEPSKSF